MMVNCRLWWPKQLLHCKPVSSFLCGWFISSSSGSFDIVVANVVPLSHSPQLVSKTDILGFTNRKMPKALHDCSPYSILGYCDADVSHENFNGESASTRRKEDGVSEADSCCSVSLQNGKKISDHVGPLCNCEVEANGWHPIHNRITKQYVHSSTNSGKWIWLTAYSTVFISKDFNWMPKFHHMHLKGRVLYSSNVHVIIYEQPSFGSHHFSLTSWNYSNHVKLSLKSPRWVAELHQEKPLSDMGIVLLGLNCAASAKTIFESSSPSKVSYIKMLSWRLVALFVASAVCLYYIILQLCHGLLSYGSQTLFYLALTKIFSFTWKILPIRSCQILYCPILLQEQAIGSSSNVEYAHKVELRKHSIWSSIILDVLLGNIFGFFLLYYEESIYVWISQLAHEITNNILRSGCVWLMGVPAGFKLNNELAAVFGLISLNVIQIWSTLWFLLDLLHHNFIRGLALSGMIFGATIPAAFCIDTIRLATLHLSVLHWMFSHLYLLQIQALASLWRLFRGQKWNPLRQRLDTYKYTVEQHVVGSLLFTPTLLLLPTTSLFHIFFTIMNITITSICMFLEIAISMIHAIPCAEIFIWMMRPRRFPSGCWFEISSAQNCKEKPETMVFTLRSTFASLGEIVSPHLGKVFAGVLLSSRISSAYGLFSGRSIPTALNTGLPPRMPWISISFRDYCQLCLGLVFASKSVEMF